MFCAICGHVAKTPVFAPKTGLIYEERLLRKALESNSGKCPVTGIELVLDGQSEDIFPVKNASVGTPRPPTANSFPGLLDTLQSEWDSLLLEQVQLRKELTETRKDLATALYEREAASGVIARLLKENEALKNELQALGEANVKDKVTSPANVSAEVKHADTVAACENALQCARTNSKKNNEERSKRIVQVASKWKEEFYFTPHGTKKPGVSCLASESYDVSAGECASKWLVSGGVDGTVSILDSESRKVAATLKKHSQRVNDVCLRCGIIASASNDKSVVIWGGQWGDNSLPQLVAKSEIKSHEKGVVASPIHPSCKFVASAGKDGKWMLHDIDLNEIVLTYSHKVPLECGRFHPDGRLFGVSDTKGEIHLFSLGFDGELKPVTDALCHGDKVNSIAFSENGYILASAGADGLAKIWDLRKPGKSVGMLSNDSQKTKGSAKVQATAIQFDFTGLNVAVGYSGGGVNIFSRARKTEWKSVVSIPDYSNALITGFVFESEAQGLWASSMDRHVKLYR